MRRAGGFDFGEWLAIVTIVCFVAGLIYSGVWVVRNDQCSRSALAAGYPSHRITWALECYGTNLTEARRL